MEFTLLFPMILVVMVVVLHISKEGKGFPKKNEADEENEGRTAVTEERDEQNMLYQQALQNENFQYINSQSNPPDNPLGHATTNNQTTEETSPGTGTEPLHGFRPQTVPGTQTQSLTIPNDSQSGNVPQRPRPTPQTETGVPAQELTIVVENPPQVPQMENDVQVPQIENEVQVPPMEREFTISFGVIGFSGTMLGAYFSLLESNKQISDHMVLYETSIWLLYISLYLGLIMLTITIIRPCTHNRCTFYCFLYLAVVSGTYAISIGIYLLLPKSTIRLVILSVLPTALLLVAMILHFKDKIVRLFRFKQHLN
ncbi:uncharacterized protein LOC131221157 [Magnolia sinica]|uniref:uncharacterized protein LOC131221157 n=1 Tax=Magnolia sinica TaxID=86752 RepID=UPI0026585ECF|nr:uncharacterized protein LOC131221157 [Magnolia sinica]XP_058072290.1 uncharacterized protein LOC131221157 [Magnolia sinica]XP_058072291.1 uncharacterized protein LOC131221157 [Magnolia sinica]